LRISKFALEALSAPKSDRAMNSDTTNPPSLISPEQDRDNEHLKLLSIFHFVAGSLALCGIGFLVLHYFVMHTVFANPQMWKGPNGPAGPPAEFFQIFRWFYLVMGLAMAVAFLANVASGIFLRQRKHRTFSLVVAALNCLQIPFGTVLGVFTIIILMRESVRKAYAAPSGTGLR
jgi:hypothetical protein